MMNPSQLDKSVHLVRSPFFEAYPNIIHLSQININNNNNNNDNMLCIMQYMDQSNTYTYV